MSDPYNTSNKVFSQIADGPNESRVAAYVNRVLNRQEGVVLLMQARARMSVPQIWHTKAFGQWLDLLRY
uniref:Uncharacterized protein n=1 Tax=Globisporangium ultimum (strain ATCC 200006 / CBS 805.95 / DAOM BR144) TaxID=431595 RepID=K3XBV1_GLOUD